MRIFLVFMFSLFLFGCGAEEKYPESFGEILRYQVGDKISDSEIKRIGFSESQRDENRDVILYERDDAKAGADGIRLSHLFVSNNIVKSVAFKYYAGNKNLLDEMNAKLKRYIESKWSADFQLVREQDSRTVYLAEIQGSPNVSASVISVLDNGPFYEVTIGFIPEDLRAVMDF